jgi:DNA topoisomerase IB
MAAVALASVDARSKTARKRAISAAMRDVAELLGNTPAVARKSYVDPRVADLYESGTTVKLSEVKPGPNGRQQVEREVIALLAS